MGYIAALDIGTTTIRCQILNHQAKCVGASFDTVSCHFSVCVYKRQRQNFQVKLHYPDTNSVEIVPEELWNATLQVVKNAVKSSVLKFRKQFRKWMFV